MNKSAVFTPVLIVKNLCKTVTNLETNEPLVILHEVSVVIQPAETVAIVGPSGSGKSTLLGLLAGLDAPTSGSVQLVGQDIFRLNEDQRAMLRAQHIGFVFQSFQLLPSLTALENVMLPLEIIGNENARRMAEETLQRVGLVHRLYHYPAQLSGGEQQRVAIARAFATRPHILLADEPTGNLDTTTGKQIIDLLFSLNRENNTTLILVTHDHSLAQRCHQVLQLEAGKLIANNWSN